MTITQLTNVPSTSDPANFDTNADNLFGVQLPRLIDEMNVATLAMSLNATNDTSSTPNTIATSGDFTFTVSAGKSFLPGMSLVAADTAAPTTNGMFGQVKSYSGTTLVFTATSKYGSGTKSAWTISQSVATSSYTNGASATSDITMSSGAAIEESMSTVASATTPDIWTNTSNIINYTGNTPATGFAAATQAGQRRVLVLAGAAPFTAGANMLIDGVASGSTLTLSANDRVEVIALTTTQFRLLPIKSDGTANVSQNVSVRQTVLSGPVDSNGLPSFGGSTGSTTVTATGTLVATAANGFGSFGAINRIGSITNPSWTGLSTNGTMYLYLDIAADGTCTTGSVTLAPTYQWGGTYSTTNNQHTFNIQEWTMKVGNGSSASQTYRLFVGEVTVAGGVVTAITWYALMGRYRSANVACTTTATTTSFSHNIGYSDVRGDLFLVCGTTQANIAVGEVIENIATQSGTAYLPLEVRCQPDRKTAKVTTGSSAAYVAEDASTGTATTLTAANFTQFIYVYRSW